MKQLPLAAYPLLVAQRLRRCWPRALVDLAVEIVSLLAIELLLLLKNILRVPRVFKRTAPTGAFGVAAAIVAPQLLRGAWLRATLWVGRADGEDRPPLHLCFFTVERTSAGTCFCGRYCGVAHSAAFAF